MSQQANHKYGRSVIALAGGPYDAHTFVGDGRESEARFHLETQLDMHGKPCGRIAPNPVDDGAIVYRNTGGRNIVGDPVFRFAESAYAEP